MMTIASGATFVMKSRADTDRIFPGWNTWRPAPIANSFTGEVAISWPRPRGRSGWVITASTDISPAAASARKAGNANSGVPQKIMRSATAPLPIPGFLEFSDFAFDEIAFQHADVLNEKCSGKMIDFMGERARQKPFAEHFEILARCILRFHGDVHRPHHIGAKP